jgi:hypothetical protein
MRELENVMSFATGKSPYSPPLIIEILSETLSETLSPSNRPEENNSKSVSAFSLAAPASLARRSRTIEVSRPGAATRILKPGDYLRKAKALPSS